MDTAQNDPKHSFLAAIETPLTIFRALERHITAAVYHGTDSDLRRFMDFDLGPKQTALLYSTFNRRIDLSGESCFDGSDAPLKRRMQFSAFEQPAQFLALQYFFSRTESESLLSETHKFVTQLQLIDHNYSLAFNLARNTSPERAQEAKTRLEAQPDQLTLEDAVIVMRHYVTQPLRDALATFREAASEANAKWERKNKEMFDIINTTRPDLVQKFSGTGNPEFDGLRDQELAAAIVATSYNWNADVTKCTYNFSSLRPDAWKAAVLADRGISVATEKGTQR